MEDNRASQVLLTMLAVSLLGGSAQVGAIRYVEPLSTVSEPQNPRITNAPVKADHPALAFARSVRDGTPQATLMEGNRDTIVKALKDAKFVALDGNYGPDNDADGFYSEDMNCTVLLTRKSPLWLTAKKGQPSIDLHYPAKMMYGPY